MSVTPEQDQANSEYLKSIVDTCSTEELLRLIAIMITVAPQTEKSFRLLFKVQCNVNVRRS